MERRKFIQNAGIAAGAAIIAPSLISAAAEKTGKLVILHTNDTHSNIDPFPANHAKYPSQGGVSPRAAQIEKIRSEEENVLLLDAGDIFQGTPYFNKFRGIVEMRTMKEMGYDAVTMGNHDFDIAPHGYKQAREAAGAAFPVVVANYDVSETVLSALVKPHVTLRKGPLKIGIFGLGINLEGLVAAQNTKGVKYLDPVETARQQVKALKAKDCDLIICLSHLGYEYPTDQISDRRLAELTEGIDVIIGGHTHTFLEEPVTLKNAAGEDVIVNQVGYGGLFLGRIDLSFNKGKKAKSGSEKLALV